MSSAAAKYTRAREFCGFFSHRGEQLPAAIEPLDGSFDDPASRSRPTPTRPAFLAAAADVG